MQQIKKGWKKVKLGDVLEKIIGGGTPSKKVEEYWNGDIFWCSVKDMGEGVFKLNSTQDKISELGLKNSATNLIPKGNIIISTRMGLGRGFINQIDMAINQDLKALFPNKNIDRDFLFWNYISKGKEIEGMGQGTTVKGIRLEDLKSLEILLPLLLIQQKIASVLSKYDDLIENNNKRIKVLEEIAQSVYEEWFVNFNFPGSESVKMVDSGNDDFGMVPEGWEVKDIVNYVDFIRGVEPGSKNYKEKRGKNDINFIRVGDLGKRNSGIFIDNSLTKGKIINESDVLVTFDGTVGIVKRGFNGCYSTGMRKIIGKSELLSNEYLYLLFKSEYIQNKIKEHAKGTTILHAGESIKYMKIIIASNLIFEEFNKLIFSVIEEVLNIEKQNKNLKKTRDLLIGRLVSGELDVDSLDVK